MPCTICKQTGHNARSCVRNMTAVIEAKSDKAKSDKAKSDKAKPDKAKPDKAKPTKKAIRKMDNNLIVKKDIVPIELDCKDLRIKRQENNDNIVLEALLNENTTEKQLKTVSNEKELYRVLKSAQITFEQFMKKCREDRIFAIVVAGRISINASRQGAKDEDFILQTCNETSRKFGIEIINLPNTEARPTKDGKILSKKEYEKSEFKKNDCLKSFDGRIVGKISGWIFAKITINNGGHQDNAFEEAHCMGDWIVKYGKPEELYVLLIDTDLTDQFNELQQKYHKNNLLVVNHIDFQQYLINEYNV